MRRKYSLIASGQKVSRWDRPLRRLWEMFYRVFLQLPVFAQRPVTGFFHAVIFWGFLVFLGVTLNHVAEGFFAGFSLFGHGALYSLLLFAANLFAGLIIAGRPLFFRAPLRRPGQEPGAPLLAVADRAFFHLHPDGQLPVL